MRLINFDGVYLNVDRISSLIPQASGGTLIVMTTNLQHFSPMGEAELRKYADLYTRSELEKCVEDVIRANPTLDRLHRALQVRDKFPYAPLAEVMHLMRRKEKHV